MRTCYASCLGDCDQGLSNEHYMGHAILDRLGPYHELSNAAWLPSGRDSISLPSQAIKSRILCGHHNGQLARLDEFGIAFCDLLLDVFGAPDAQPAPRQIEMSGYDLERWVLKVAVGALVSGTLKHDNEGPYWRPSESWIRVLFGKALSADMGFNFVEHLATPHRGYGLAPLTFPENSEIVGAVFEFMGLWMVVTPDSLARPGIMEQNGSPLPMSARPASLTFRNERGTWQLHLDWLGRGSGVRVEYSKQGR